MKAWNVYRIVSASKSVKVDTVFYSESLDATDVYWNEEDCHDFPIIVKPADDIEDVE